MRQFDMYEERFEYIHPQGYLEYIGTLPFLGKMTCPLRKLEAGSWQELVLDYEVGSAGLADGAWIKVTFKFYSDWALFQCEDPRGANYLSAEYQARPTLPGESQATVQSLKVRFDQKGHERPYQKAIIVDIVDGYLKPGDHILIRLGDRRAGGPGTRIQTFVEEAFRFRSYIDPVGTSRFAAIPGDIVLDIVPGPPANLVTVAPPLVKTGAAFPLLMRVEDRWGNTCCDIGGAIDLDYHNEHGTSGSVSDVVPRELPLPRRGWAVVKQRLMFDTAENITVQGSLKGTHLRSEPLRIEVEDDLPFARPYFADLHVHSNNTVGTNSTEYNLSYGRDVASLDVLGYTANDFHINEQAWKKDVALCQEFTRERDFICYPGTEWCGNSAAGGDHNIIFLGDSVLFPTGREEQVVRSFEWNEEMKGQELTAGTWPIDRLYEAYIHDAENHLLIPHVGGRRANLDWHHPKLDRLIEITSSWGHFAWFYQDAISRGYKLGASAAGDEHRGRCGGGSPGAAVFGVKGGITGIIAPALTKSSINHALYSRHTWATTGERSVALLRCGAYIQGDEFEVPGTSPVEISYRLVGNTGWDEICAYTDEGLLWRRNLQKEQGLASNRIRLRWGGARIRDRYRAAEWTGILKYRDTLVNSYVAYGLEHPEEYVRRSGPTEIAFRSDTYGDSDAIEMEISDLEHGVFEVTLKIGSYAKVGSPLDEHPYVHHPEVHWQFTGKELLEHGGRTQESPLQLGGADLHVAVERVSQQPLPHDVQGSFLLEPREGRYGFVPLYIMGRQKDDAKVWTSPLFITWR